MTPAKWQLVRDRADIIRPHGVPALADQIAAALMAAANNDDELGIQIEPTVNERGEIELDVSFFESFITDPVPELSKAAFAKAVADCIRDLADHIEEAGR